MNGKDMNEPQLPKNLLEEANGNYLLAFTMFVDRLGMPRFVKTIVKSVFLGLALAAALTALFWPWLME